jgi:hypothetical protein
MAPSFGRSISFPLSPARSSSSKQQQQAARHVRSISLPTSRGGAHPLLAHLHNAAVRDSTPSSGLAHIDALLHAALLLLPEARAALRAGSATADYLLDAFLALADAHGAFQEAVLDLKRHAADVQAALRRRDAARLASAVRAQRQAEKDIARLAASVRAAYKGPRVGALATAAELELAEVVAAIASASSAVFSAVEFISSAATAAASKKSSTTIISLVVRRRTTTTASSDEEKELAALQRLQDLDDCIAEIQTGSGKVFRSILHTRVTLLNTQTQTCC